MGNRGGEIEIGAAAAADAALMVQAALAGREDAWPLFAIGCGTLAPLG